MDAESPVDFTCSSVSGASLHLHYEIRRSNYVEAVQIRVDRETGSYVLPCFATVLLLYSLWKAVEGCSVVWPVVGIFIFMVAVLQRALSVISETVLVVSGVGMQVTETKYIGLESTHFFRCSDIKEVIINEAITMHRIIFYIVVIVGVETERLFPLFLNTRPRLQQLQLIRRLLRDVLALNIERSGR
jgi:hypothetical protein